MIFYRWFVWPVYLYVIFASYVSADWPSITTSTAKLLGIFPDSGNISSLDVLSVHSRAMFHAAILLAYRYNITAGGQTIGWEIVQTGGSITNVFRSTCFAISSTNIVGIVGPALSRESHIIAPLTKTIDIPVISYSATDPDLSDRSVYPTFFRTIPSDSTAALAVMKLFIEYNWTSCIIIYQNDAFGSNGAKAIDEAFYKSNLRITEMIVFDVSTLTIRGDLKSVLRSSVSRIVVVWAQSAYTELILQNALHNDVLGPYFLWILSETISLDRFNSTSHQQLIGILTIRAVVGSVVQAPINNTLLSTAYELWQEFEPESFPGSDNVDYDALFAFDATWTLVGALQDFCSTMTNISSPCISIVNTSFCFDRRLLGSSSLLNIIRNRTFLGVSGWVGFDSTTTDRVDGTYYIAQNIQQSTRGVKYASVAVWSMLNGWSSYTTASVFVWPGNTLTRPTGYAAISGTTIDIAVLELTPFTLVTYATDQSGQSIQKLSGYMPDLINLLSAKMGFIPNITVFPSNQSYNSLVDLVEHGLYDMVVADLTITSNRRERITFSTAIFDNSLRIIVRESSSTDLDLLAYLRPFSTKLWVIVLITTIYAGLLICCFERRVNEGLQDRSKAVTIGLSLWYSIGILFGYGTEIQAKTAAGRLLTAGLYTLCLILVAAYTANLASDLTISKSRDFISGIDDIKNAKIAPNRIGIIVNSSIEDYYLREVSDGKRNYYPLRSSIEIYPNLLDGKIDAAINDVGVLNYATTNIYCNLTLVGVDFERTSFGIAVQKNWQYARELDINILSLKETGALTKLKDTWFEGNHCVAPPAPSTAMTIESMAGLFLTFGIISILAIFIFLCTKRLILKNHLLTLIRSKSLLSQRRETSPKPTGQSTTLEVFDSNYNSSPATHF